MSEQSRRQRPRVLVVEDHTDTAQLVLTILEGSGYDATLVGDADSAFKVLSEKNGAQRPAPDVVLLDLSMPGLSPVEMVKKLGPEHMPPVVVMSAKPEYVLAAAAKEIGAAAVVRKPFTIDDLLQSIDRVAAQRT